MSGITENRLNSIREAARAYMSDKRYVHTLGVESCAAYLSKVCAPEYELQVRCAALLHDISKELTYEEQIAYLSHISDVTNEDIKCSPVHHSLTAEVVIQRDFPDASDPIIISAVRKHTTGDECMSVVDKIIFISDYIEEGRTHPACVECREMLFCGITLANGKDEAILRLNEATLLALDNTIRHLEQRGEYIHKRTLKARKSLAESLKR